MEQSAVVLQVIDILDSVYSDVEEFKHEQARKGQTQPERAGKGKGVLTSRG